MNKKELIKIFEKQTGHKIENINKTNKETIGDTLLKIYNKGYDKGCSDGWNDCVGVYGLKVAIK